MSRTLCGIFAVAACLPFLAVPDTARAQGGVQAGMLSCTVEGGAGFIFGSSKALACAFEPAGGPRELYHGTIDRFGIDIGVTGETVIAWAVFAPSGYVGPGALEGTYGGVSAEATAGVGVGANALIGGSGDSFTLQPVSVQAQTGLNVAAGIAQMQLVAVLE